SWRIGGNTARRWWRRRGSAGPVHERRHRRGRPRHSAPGRRREVVRQLLARAHGRDCREERRPGQGELNLIMRALVVDVGGTHVKVLATGEETSREFPSGPALTAAEMVAGVKIAAAGWKYDAVSIGYPGPVLHGRPVAEPRHLGPGWVGFDYPSAFGCPVKVVNDAAMQALGSYRGGRMLFLGLGTGLGSTFIVDGIVEPMELGHLPYRNGTFEEYVGLHGLQANGLTQWRH